MGSQYGGRTHKSGKFVDIFGKVEVHSKRDCVDGSTISGKRKNNSCIFWIRQKSPVKNLIEDLK